MDIPDSIIKKLGSLGLDFNSSPSQEAEDERHHLIDKYCHCDGSEDPEKCAAKIPVRLAFLHHMGATEAEAKAFSDAIEAAGLALVCTVPNPPIPPEALEMIAQAVRAGVLPYDVLDRSRGSGH